MNHTRRTFLRLALAGSGALILSACRKTETAGRARGVRYYTCSMHPWVRAATPGKCPVCGMDLIPVMTQGATAAASAGPPEFTVAADRQQQIGVTYARVERRSLRLKTRAAGTVDYDRQRDWAFVARTDGFIKRLFVTSPGEIVAAGQPLLSYYSPDLFTAEREYVMLLGMREEPGLLEAARGRLRQWNVSDADIAELEKNRKPAEEVALCSPFRGVVREVAPEQGGSVKAGEKLVEVVDLSRVWVWADFYEAELGALRLGQRAMVTVNGDPGEEIEGEISLIDPFLDEGRRTFKVRIDLANPDLRLRPGMYAEATVESDRGEGLVIPLNAVMPTGTRDLVFVEKGEGKLEPREVTLGGEYDGFYEVKRGLKEGERIVASATFLIDSEAQVQGALKDFAGPAGEGPQ
jgi:Cu(I)/Ag(I) efflux system membrane fusion protein